MSVIGTIRLLVIIDLELMASICAQCRCLFVKTQMWSLMGCAVVRVQPQQAVAGHADKQEMARRRHMTSGQLQMAPAVSSERQDKSTVNGAAEAGSKNSVGLKSHQSCNISSHETDPHLATCSSHSQAPAVQVRHLIPQSHSYCLSLSLCLEWYNGSIIQVHGCTQA